MPMSEQVTREWARTATLGWIPKDLLPRGVVGAATLAALGRMGGGWILRETALQI